MLDNKRCCTCSSAMALACKFRSLNDMSAPVRLWHILSNSSLTTFMNRHTATVAQEMPEKLADLPKVPMPRRAQLSLRILKV